MSVSLICILADNALRSNNLLAAENDGIYRNNLAFQAVPSGRICGKRSGAGCAMVAARLPDFFEDVFPMQDEKSLPFPALLGLGATQILGYGTLYYAFSILVPDIARDFRHSEEWVFGAFSASLLIGGLAAPFSGRLADRFGGARIMGWGSVASALALAATAMAPGAACFVACLVLMQLVSSTVLYATAFTTIVQAGGLRAQTSIVHLTLFAGFASTLFWPLTSWAHGFLGWREIYLAFGAVNLFVCAPIHLSLIHI